MNIKISLFGLFFQVKIAKDKYTLNIPTHTIKPTSLDQVEFRRWLKNE